MQSAWLHRNNQRQCILFFSGWGMDPAPFRRLPAAHHDLCMLYDYRHLHPVDLEPFAGYERLHLIAWSMGVWVAAHLMADQAASFASATAIGGTLIPVDKQCGLPPDSFAAMIDTFDQDVLDTFYRNMFDDEEQLARFLANRPQRDLSELRDEMVAFRAAFFQNGPGIDIFNRKLVTSRDRIFSGRNQMRAWGKGSCVTVNWPHFPFYGLADWQELISITPP
jgi:pimeloyl-[acyl-carrier protein] methyl ester esterase